ncbi:MAG: UDP-N-acetylglucosamine 2-epimerase (non-hydrolyzing) [Candidatus Margulisiibacteriota bacterium]|jgi:UDP-N-acetylglucosamine 2-epimerase (non-hydrolysing)
MAKKILAVFGTRPEAIKMAPVIKKLQEDPKRFEVKICVTAQHRQMLDQVLQLFEIIPDYDLNIMAPNQNLFDVTGKALMGLENVLKAEKPDLVLAQGDTTTVFAAALASYYLKIPFGHVEAGLRTQNKYSPFPEEINRQLATRIADLHFAPTKLAKQNLLAEGVPAKKIFVTGNTVIDALFYTVKKNAVVSSQYSVDSRQHTGSFSSANPLSAIRNLQSKIQNPKSKIILLTAHRRENFGDGMKSICQAILEIVKKNKDVQVIYPVHLNPNVQDPVNTYLKDKDRIHLISPLDYAPFVDLLASSYLVLTDSGGIQEEAPSLGKPVLVLRDTTERPEAVTAGTVKLVGTNKDRIVKEASRLIQSKTAYNKMTRAHNPYGDGKSAKRIAEICGRG